MLGHPFAALRTHCRPRTVAENAVRPAQWPLGVKPSTRNVCRNRELRPGFDIQARLPETVIATRRRLIVSGNHPDEGSCTGALREPIAIWLRQ